MTTYDPINAYLSNEMTPDQERQFLISVASSDNLRRALKSEVMIERIITRDEREMAVPHTLRAAILAEAGAVTTVPPSAHSPVPSSSVPRYWRWLGGGTIGAAGVAVGLLLSQIAAPQSTLPRAVRKVAPAPALAMPVMTVPVPVPTSTTVVVNQAGQEQVRTVVIDRFIPGRPVASVQRSVNSTAAPADQIKVTDYAKDNPLDPRGDKKGGGGVQAGSAGQSSPLAPAR